MPAVNSLAHPQRGHSSWAGRGGIFGFMSPGRRVVDTLLAVNAAAFLAQKLFPWVSARFARVSAHGKQPTCFAPARLGMWPSD